MKQFVLFAFALAIIACSQAMDYRRHSALKHEESPVYDADVLMIHEPAVLINQDDHLARLLNDDNPTDQGIGALDREEFDEDQEVRLKRSPSDPPTGKVVVTGGARRGSSTGGRTEGNIHVGGEIRFRRSAEEQSQDVESHGESKVNLDDGLLHLGHFEEEQANSGLMEDGKITELGEKLMEVEVKERLGDYDKEVAEGTETRVRRSPEPRRHHHHRTNVDLSLQKTFTDRRGNTFSINGGASKRPGERWDPQVGVSGSFRF